MTRVRVLSVVLSCVALASPAGAAPSPQGTYTQHTWPASAGGYYNLDAFVTVEAVDSAAGYFWAHQFTLQNNVPGGYVGLQNMGLFFDGTKGKLAIFSIWDADAASGPSCQTFGGEGSGQSCRIPYAWKLGRTYRLRIWAVSDDATGRWWGAWVEDLTAKQDAYIGQIHVPSTAAWLDGWSVTWTEYFGGALASCTDQPYARARWSAPTANNGTVKPSKSNSYLSTSAGCQNGKVTPTGGDAVHEMGLGGPCTPSCGCGGAPDGCGGTCSQPCGDGVVVADAGPPIPDGCLRGPCVDLFQPPPADAGAPGEGGLPPLYDPDTPAAKQDSGCSLARPPTGLCPAMLLLPLLLVRRRQRS